MLDWFKDHDTLLGWLTAASAVMFIASLIAVPILVARIPADYFAFEKRSAGHRSGQHPVLRTLWLVIKNLLGVVLLLAGLSMLVLPGQGLLTMLFGLMLLDIPGKYRFEKWLISRPKIRSSIDWLRRRAGREPLELGDHQTG